ncbi:MAG: T9SS type A sorting domain-containing protein [Bacteroidota bacterium]|nr:T9SS type A sorting domain-containing protein [Bacteroidota bacterium]
MKNIFKNLLLFISLIASNNLIQAQISGNSYICEGTSNSYNCDQTSSTYLWNVSPSSGVGISDATIQTPDISFPTAGTYTVSVSTTGPVSTFTLGVTVNQTPIISFITSQTVCPNISTSAINFSSTPVGATVSWTNSDPGIGIANSGTGNIPSFTTINWGLTPLTGYFTAIPGLNGCLGVPQTFTITVNPSTNISGTITSNATTITDGQVYLFAPSQTLYMYDTIAITSLNASGQYLFSSVTSGNYLVKCIPDNSVYPNPIGTYYGNASQWDSAMVINHDCANDFVADIELVIASLLTGPGIISGHLIEGVGYGTNRMINSTNEIMAPGGPIKGIPINLLTTPSGQFQGQSISDSTGYFEFTNVPVGDYTLLADIPGLTMDSSYFIQITPNAFVSGMNSVSSAIYTDLDFMVDSNSISPINPFVGIPELKNKAQEISVYPNPAKNSVTFKANGFESKTYRIELINSQGQSVFIDKQSAASDYILDLKKLNITSGLYVVKLSSGNVIKTTKLIIE